jgi:NAD(P)-dependent dehydrogenase (short-subunit alcohol dehydrogenase family)
MDDYDSDQAIDLSGQVAIVTGGGRGIGRAIVLALARAGAAVAVVARTETEINETTALVHEAGGQAIALQVDVTDQQAVERAVAETDQQLGPVDLLVSNAGHPGEVGATWKVDPDEWWRCIDVNLRGPYLCARAIVPGMIARGGGRIVTTASHTGLGLWPGMSAYAISKAAVIRLCETLAAEVAEHSIRVFAIHPGSVETALTASQFTSEGARTWFPKLYDYVSRGGGGQPPEHAADLVVFLASGRADALSGCFVNVRKDVNEMVQRADEIRQGELYTLRLRT